MVKIELNNFSLKPHTCLAVTPSVPLKAVTREIIYAIQTRTTVLTGVINTVIYVCLKKIKGVFNDAVNKLNNPKNNKQINSRV